MCEKGWKWVKLGENATSPMWKKHYNLQSITKYGSLVRPDAQIAALDPHGGAYWLQKCCFGPASTVVGKTCWACSHLCALY